MGLSAFFNIVTGFAMLVLFIRFMAQFAGLKPSNPYVEPIFILTKVVDIYEKIFKPLSDGRICTAAIVLMFLVRSIDIAGNLILQNLGYNAQQLLYVAATSLVFDFLGMARLIIFVAIIASLIMLIAQKANPWVEILMQLSEPIIAPFRKISPNLGMLDISPMVAILAIILCEIIMETLTSRMLPMMVIDRQALIFTAQYLDMMQ